MARLLVHLVTGDTVTVPIRDTHFLGAAETINALVDNYDPKTAFRCEDRFFPWQSVNWIEVEDDK